MSNDNIMSAISTHIKHRIIWNIYFWEKRQNFNVISMHNVSTCLLCIYIQVHTRKMSPRGFNTHAYTITQKQHIHTCVYIYIYENTNPRATLHTHNDMHSGITAHTHAHKLAHPYKLQ